MASKLIDNSKYGCNKKAEKLNTRQRAFVFEMLADMSGSATEAARKAGYKNPSVMASKLLKNPIINQMLGSERRKREERTQIKADEVLQILWDALTFDPLELFHSDDGMLTIKALETVPKHLRCLITEIDCKTRTIDSDGNTETSIKVKWVSKDLALRLAMQHTGLLEDAGNGTNVNVNVNQNLVAQIREAAESKSKVIDGKAIERMAKG